MNQSLIAIEGTTYCIEKVGMSLRGESGVRCTLDSFGGCQES